MNLLVEQVDVWVAAIEDRPGGLTDVLGELKKAGADPQFIMARRSAERPGKGVMFVSPLEGDRQIRVAAELGFNVSQSLHSVRVVGRDRPGIATELTRKVADARMNLRGFSASVTGTQFVAYLVFDSPADADRAVPLLGRGLTLVA